MTIRDGKSGIRFDVRCHHGAGLPAGSDEIEVEQEHLGALVLISVKRMADGVIPIVSCRHCGLLWRETWDSVLPFVEDGEASSEAVTASEIAARQRSPHRHPKRKGFPMKLNKAKRRFKAAAENSRHVEPAAMTRYAFGPAAFEIDSLPSPVPGCYLPRFFRGAGQPWQGHRPPGEEGAGRDSQGAGLRLRNLHSDGRQRRTSTS